MLTFHALLASLALVCVIASPRIYSRQVAQYMRALEGSRFDVMHDECGFEYDERIECGKRTYDELQCRSRGCCFSACEDCPREVPFCFLAKRMVENPSCDVAYEDKDDCGYYGISEGECVGIRDCCWRPSAKSNDPPCFKKAKGQNVRLVNGETSETTISGRLEVQHEGVWGTVCDDNFGSSAAEVVCASLGYEYSLPKGSATYGEGGGSILLDGFSCDGDEESITECNSINWGSHDCSHSEDAGAICSHEKIEDDSYDYYDSYNYPDYYSSYYYDSYEEYYDPYEYTSDEYNGGEDSSEGGEEEEYPWYRGGKGKGKAKGRKIKGGARGRGRNGFKGKPKRHLAESRAAGEKKHQRQAGRRSVDDILHKLNLFKKWE